MLKKWAWISGWGIQPERFQQAVERALPDASHQVFAPEPGAIDAALSSGASHFGGYSLGSLLLMTALDRIDSTRKVVYLAPIPAFCNEAGLGGLTPRSNLESLQVKLERKPEAALKLFYRLAGLSEEPTDRLPYSVDSLKWGLEMLATLSAPSSAFERVHAIIGEKDSMMDATTLSEQFPSHTRVAQSHDYHNLIPLAATLK